MESQRIRYTHMLFGSPRVDRFEEWLHDPAPLESMHARFDIRRAIPAEFDDIYELVNAVFGLKRSPAEYDWLYRRNPYGIARCWVVFDRASGRLIGSNASWPWPIARGTHGVEGGQEGDWVMAPGWQRQGIDGLRSEVLRSHAWQAKTVGLSWPNEKSRGASIKRGRAAEIVGPVPKTALLLNAKAFLAEHNWPALASTAGGALVGTALAAWREFLFRDQTELAVEAVRRFESSVDEVTLRCMTWPGFWSPHDADFLNWRYLKHPTAHYLAFAQVDGGELAGYYVLKIDGRASWLMEFVTPVSPRRLSSALLLHLIKTAQAAGCTHILFSAPPRWRHWKLLHAVGFLPMPSGIYISPSGEEPEVRQLSMWQWVPGDMDWV